MLLENRGVKRGKGTNQGDLSATVAECSNELGVSERTARHRVAQADKYAGSCKFLPAEERKGGSRHSRESATVPFLASSFFRAEDLVHRASGSRCAHEGESRRLGSEKAGDSRQISRKLFGRRAENTVHCPQRSRAGPK